MKCNTQKYVQLVKVKVGCILKTIMAKTKHIRTSWLLERNHIDKFQTFIETIIYTGQ